MSGKGMDENKTSELESIWDEARSHIERGDFDKAIEIYNYIIIRYNDEAIAVEHANAYLANIYLTLEQNDLAEHHIKKAIDYRPEKPGYHYILGFVYSRKSRWDMAISEFKSAVTGEPDNGEYIRGLGWAICQGGNLDRGLQLLEKAERLDPANANILTDLAITHLSLLNLDTAEEYAKRAVTVAPTNIIAKDVLKKILRFRKLYGHTVRKS